METTAIKTDPGIKTNKSQSTRLETNADSDRILRSVWTTLRYTFGILAIVAGLDKFTDLLTKWEMYLHPGIISMLPFSAHTFMVIVGIIEIIAGFIVLIAPEIGGYVIMAWLIAIALNLITSGSYLDVAVRDIVMSIGAMCLARISKIVPYRAQF